MNAGKMESAGKMGLEMHERRKDGSGGDHAGTLLQDRSRHRPPELLSRLDDVSGSAWSTAFTTADEVRTGNR